MYGDYRITLFVVNHFHPPVFGNECRLHHLRLPGESHIGHQVT